MKRLASWRPSTPNIAQNCWSYNGLSTVSASVGRWRSWLPLLLGLGRRRWRMADLNPTLVGKVAKLIPMLSSDCEGEVLATARGLVRTLQSAGLDLHDLAAAV